MPHTPPIPSPIPCPAPSCGRVFMHPRDLKLHSQMHEAGWYEDPQLKCPRDGCSFKAAQLKRLEAHVDAAHYDQPRPFQCLEDLCGFSTTSQGALTRHYRERHHIEPPTTVRTARRRPPRKKYDLQQHGPVASTSRLSEPHVSSISRFNSQEPPSFVSGVTSSALSASSTRSTALAPEINKYYPSTVYYPTSPNSSTSSTPPPSENISAYLTGHTQRTAGTAPLCPLHLCPPKGPHSDRDSGTAKWVSWRDECDVAPDVIAVATGERTLCERSMLISMTEYLPVPPDVAIAVVQNGPPAAFQK
ncbi:hypothetical protein B0H13DRAFT_2450625 [Mycena leptocephala]|nr:hypothetical protein B0H13DRAFT_2450625 [Mycena leptocephala]